MKTNPTNQRNYLLTAAAWQDSLLQSYRTFHVTIQGFLITAGSAVLAVQLTGAVQAPFPKDSQIVETLLANLVFNAIFTILLFFLFWLQRRTSTDIACTIMNRAQDVNHWHKEIMLLENEFDVEQRSFTYFKMWQQAKRGSVEYLLPKFLPPEGLTKEHAEELIGKGLAHTRNIIDVNLFKHLQFLWYAIVFTSCCVTLWFAWNYYHFKILSL